MRIAQITAVTALSCHILSLASSAFGEEGLTAAKPDNYVSPVILIIAYDRISHLRKTIRSLVEAKVPQRSNPIPIYVSVDDNRRAQR